MSPKKKKREKEKSKKQMTGLHRKLLTCGSPWLFGLTRKCAHVQREALTYEACSRFAERQDKKLDRASARLCHYCAKWFLREGAWLFRTDNLGPLKAGHFDWLSSLVFAKKQRRVVRKRGPEDRQRGREILLLLLLLLLFF